MKSILLLIFILSLHAVEPISSSGTIDFLVFGKSHHSNREAGYNENNPGIGLGIAFTGDELFNVLIETGVYKDSYNKTGKFCMAGLQFVGGDREGFHVSPGLLMGYLEGSNIKGVGIMPIIAIGYDRFDLCITGDPTGSSNETVHNPNGTVNLSKSSSMMVAVFLKFSIVKWK
jgi:hypothetical protein